MWRCARRSPDRRAASAREKSRCAAFSRRDRREHRRGLVLPGAPWWLAEGLRSRLLLQVHDELILESVTEEIDSATEILRREMGNAYPLKAPLDVNVGVGKSWNEAAH